MQRGRSCGLSGSVGKKASFSCWAHCGRVGGYLLVDVLDCFFSLSGRKLGRIWGGSHCLRDGVGWLAVPEEPGDQSILLLLTRIGCG